LIYQISHVSRQNDYSIQNNQFKEIALNLAAIQLAEVTTEIRTVALLNAVIRKTELLHIYLKKHFARSLQYAGNFTKLHGIHERGDGSQTVW
jgi:hypothetical protein